MLTGTPRVLRCSCNLAASEAAELSSKGLGKVRDGWRDGWELPVRELERVLSSGLPSWLRGPKLGQYDSIPAPPTHVRTYIQKCISLQEPIEHMTLLHHPGSRETRVQQPQGCGSCFNDRGR